MPTRRSQLLASAAAAIGACALPGCGWIPRPATTPMATRRFPSACGTGGVAGRAPDLIVLLPGRGMTLGQLERHDFARAVGAAGVDADLVLADAHLGYLRARTLVERLHADVVEPALAAGYRRIWLAGISLGGLGALLYAEAHPGVAAGLLLIAPYLGEAAGTRAVAAAGGLARWRPPEPLPAGDLDAHAWRAARRSLQAGAPPLWLAYGRDDRLAESHAVLAAALPPGHVATVAGGHDWEPWEALWIDWLGRAPLARCK